MTLPELCMLCVCCVVEGGRGRRKEGREEGRAESDIENEKFI